VIKIKDAYYFSHDANARHDPKIIKMISSYGMEGYGWYWVIIEMLREQDNYKLSINDQTDIDVMVSQTNGDPQKIKKYIDDCIKVFKLFKKSKKYLWSSSLSNRMIKMNEKREKGRKAANKRWDRECQNDAKGIPNRCQTDTLKEKKVKEKNEISDPPVLNLGEM
jgi:phage anti-repressor protein